MNQLSYKHYNQESRKKRGRFDGTTEGDISAIQTVKNGFEVEETKTQQHYHGGRDNDTGLALLHLHVSLCQVAAGDAIRRDDALSRDRRTFLYSSPLLQTKEHFFSGKHKCMLCLRGLFGSIALFFYFLSIEGLTLGDSQILSQLAAFFMCLLSPIFLKEKLPRQAIPGMLSIAIGTLCVVQIWNFNAFNMYTLFGIGGGFFSAAAYVVISCLAEKGFRSNTEIVFLFSDFQHSCRAVDFRE